MYSFNVQPLVPFDRVHGDIIKKCRSIGLTVILKKVKD